MPCRRGCVQKKIYPGISFSGHSLGWVWVSKSFFFRFLIILVNLNKTHMMKKITQKAHLDKSYVEFKISKTVTEPPVKEVKSLLFCLVIREWYSFPPELGGSGKDIPRAAPNRPSGLTLGSVWSCPRDVFSKPTLLRSGGGEYHIPHLKWGMYCSQLLKRTQRNKIRT